MVEASDVATRRALIKYGGNEDERQAVLQRLVLLCCRSRRGRQQGRERQRQVERLRGGGGGGQGGAGEHAGLGRVQQLLQAVAYCLTRVHYEGGGATAAGDFHGQMHDFGWGGGISWGGRRGHVHGEGGGAGGRRSCNTGRRR